MFASDDSFCSVKNDQDGGGGAAGPEPQSLIPVRSWTLVAMSQAGLLPPLVLAASVAGAAAAAALAHCALLAALLRHSTTGLYAILIQLAVSDLIMLTTTIGPEMWSTNSQNWHFGKIGCTAYQGISFFTTSLTAYLVATLALHTVTTIRLEEKVIERRMKRNNVEDEEIRSSQHSLVANSDSSTPPRTMQVDYRLATSRVSAALPALFIWILALSLSVPEFTLASIIHKGNNVSLCTLDTSHSFHVYSTLATLNLFLPLFIISTTAILVMTKLYRNLPGTLENKDSTSLLKLSLWLMCVQVVLCAPRSMFRVYTSSFAEYPTSSIKLILINLVTSSTYLIAMLVRPVLCVVTLPQLRKYFFLSTTRTSQAV